jgi:hypothetical protein
MKLGDEVIASVGRKCLRHHRVQAEIENVDLPRSQAEGAMETEADFVKLARVVAEGLLGPDAANIVAIDGEDFAVVTFADDG